VEETSGTADTLTA